MAIGFRQVGIIHQTGIRSFLTQGRGKSKRRGGHPPWRRAGEGCAFNGGIFGAMDVFQRLEFQGAVTGRRVGGRGGWGVQ